MKGCREKSEEEGLSFSILKGGSSLGRSEADGLLSLQEAAVDILLSLWKESVRLWDI